MQHRDNLEKKPEDFCKLAEEYYKHNNYDKALELSEEALKLDNKHAMAYLIRGNVYYFSQDHLDLLEAFTNYRLSQLFSPPTLEGATIRTMANVTLGSIYLTKRCFEDAIECTSQALETIPTSDAICYETSTIYSIRATAYERRASLRSYDDKIGIRSDYEHAISDYQTGNVRANYVEQLQELVQKLPPAQKTLLKLKPIVWLDIKTSLRLALEANVDGEFKEAIQYCNEALKLDPQCMKAYFIRGHSYLKQLMWNKALFDCQLVTRFQEISPSLRSDQMEIAIHCLGTAHLHLGNLDQAMACFDKNIADSNYIFSYCRRAETHAKQHRLDAAFVDLHQAIKLASPASFKDPEGARAVATRTLKTLLEKKEKREIFAIIKTIAPLATQLEILKDCVENKESVFGERFWKKEGLVAPSPMREGSWLYEVNAYYQRINPDNRMSEAPKVKESRGLLDSIKMTFMPPPKIKPVEEIEMKENLGYTVSSP